MKNIFILLVLIIISLILVSCNDNIETVPTDENLNTTEDIGTTENIGTTETKENEYRLYNGYCGHSLKLEKLDENISPIKEVVEIVNADMPKQKNISIGGIEYQCDYSGSYYTNVYNYNFHRYIGSDEVKIDLYDDGGVRMFSKFNFINIGDISEKTVDEIRVLVENELEKRFPDLVEFEKYDLFRYNESISYSNSQELKSYYFNWYISKNGYETQEGISTRLNYLGNISTIYFESSSDSINACDFQLSNDQKETVINTVLENKLTTDITEYMDYYEIKSEEIVEYEDNVCLYIVADARFKVDHKDATHKYWYVPVEIILPLDEYAVAKN